jgi:5-methyltetrahydrofolate--homocysteine methyltransferase
MSRDKRIVALKATAEKRIIIMDGAMGSCLQGVALGEADYRGERFKDHPIDLKGNHDILNITRPDVIRDIHMQYFRAGADIAETNTFSATPVSQGDYDMANLAYEIAKAGAELAREAADAMTLETPHQPRYVAGAIGPTNKTLSVSPKVEDPGYRAISFDELKDAYKVNAKGLLDGGADYLLVETIFDTLNAKAAIIAVEELKDERGEDIAISLSVTVTDASGRTLSGQTVEAFWRSVRHADPLTVGMNCAFGAKDLRPFVGALAQEADTFLCAYPNAGLPDELGEYTEAPNETASELSNWANDGILNFVGGCCGTTPAHIKAIADIVKNCPPRVVPSQAHELRLSGLEPMVMI